MAWDRIEDDWKLPVGNVKENWGKLTQDDNAAINGKRGWFEGKIRELYGDGTIGPVIRGWARHARNARFPDWIGF